MILNLNPRLILFNNTYNIEWLAAVLLIRIQSVGKMNQERVNEDVLQDLIFKLNYNKTCEMMTECD